MKIPSVKGTRDLYPKLFAPIRRIFDTWRTVSVRHGFEEIEGPTLEMLDLYQEKSGEELVGQLYRLTDSGGRQLALRPEMTPTVARMVAAKIQSLSKPIKWFSIPKLFRGENVQRGRLREFFQWNVDIIGSADALADAECIAVGVEALRELGLTEKDFVVNISHRRLIASMLATAGIAAEKHPEAFALMDKFERLKNDRQWVEHWDHAFGDRLSRAHLHRIMETETTEELERQVASIGPLTQGWSEAIGETRQLITLLQNFGIMEFCNIKWDIVRGLAYYTGPVFEFHDRSEKQRAICGGGRYDDLLGRLGKAREPAVGFGMGDVVLSLLMEDRGLVDVNRKSGGGFVADAEPGLREKVYDTVARLRRKGFRTEFSYSRQSLGKQLKTADKQGCAWVVILGSETLEQGLIQIKDMVGGQDRSLAMQALLENPKKYLLSTE